MANTKSLSLTASSSQYLYTADSASLSPSTQFTIEIWIKPTSVTTEQGLVSHWKSETNQRSFIFYLSSAGKIGLLLSSDGINADTGPLDTTALTKNLWTHVAVVYNAGAIRFFLNGALNSTYSSSVTSVFNSTESFAIASETAGGSTFFDGLMDDVRFWSTNRADSEISVNYQRELAGNETNLSGYWKLDDSYSDSTSNGNNLSVSGTPSFSTDVPFADTTTTSTTTTSTSSSTSTTTTSTSTTTTSTSSSTSTSRTTSTSTTQTQTSTSTSTTTTTSTSRTTSTSTTTTSTSTTSTSTTLDLTFSIELI